MGGQILVGDALTVLRTLPDESVQCCVTSPPYWGLRDYGVEGQLGLEKTPGEYVENLVAIFAEVRRVLREDGTCWVNLGDSYMNAKGQAGGVDPKQPARRHGLRPQDVSIEGLKPKDLVGIPWRVAFALQDDSWYLRSDIIWAKPNPMPESVTDRPTKAHEYVFLLSKSGRYYYDADAIAEDAKPESAERYGYAFGGDKAERMTREEANGAGSRTHPIGTREATGKRNARSVWSITTQPFPEAHFATFPEEIPRRCILAGSRVGDVVLDPFAGSGTTCAVADAHQRAYVGIELNPEYAEMARRRIARDGAPLFTGVGA